MDLAAQHGMGCLQQLRSNINALESHTNDLTSAEYTPTNDSQPELNDAHGKPHDTFILTGIELLKFEHCLAAVVIHARCP